MQKRSLYGGKDAVPAGNLGGFLPRRGPLPTSDARPVVWSTPMDSDGCPEYTESHTICGKPTEENSKLCEEHLAIEVARGIESARRKHNL